MEHNKDNKQFNSSKLKQKKGTIILYFWMVILCAIILLFFITKEIPELSVLFPISLLAAWFIITVVAFIISDRKSNSNKKSVKVQEDVIIESARFGKLKFVKSQYDNSNDLRCDNVNVPFGDYNPSIEIRNYKEENRGLYFEGLEYVYDIYDEILDNFYKEAVTYCSEWGESDEDGNPITYDYIKDNFEVTNIFVDMYNEDVIVTIWGWPGDDLLSEHNLSAEINCTKKTMDYKLMG